jgi:hypothetical protein
MRQVRFFEDEDGPLLENEGRRLLVGIEDSEGPADGGRREAVRVATLADAQEFGAAYAAYYNSFVPAEETEAPAAEAPPSETREPLQPASAGF